MTLLSPPILPAADVLRDVPFDQVTLADDFWLPRLECQKEVLVPLAFLKTGPAVDYLQAAADVLAGKKLANPPAPHRYVISDLFKVMEGASYLLKSHSNPELEKKMDAIIDVIGASQTPDGYIYPAHIIGNGVQDRKNMGERPYSWVVHSHELYNVGHLYEAAVAYDKATGKHKLLDIAEKNAQHVNRVFFTGDPKYNDGKPVNQAPGHEEIELGLVKLNEQTGNPLYLEMARKFLAIRGVTYRPVGQGIMDPTYAQQHAPVLEQTEPVGHAVRAAYLYAAMADVGRLEGDPAYGKALEKIWQNMVDTRIHITGGLGAVHGTEGFGPAFELPNMDAYDETCAAVGNVFFNNRMFLNLRDGRYLDVAEIALYNNVLAGTNLEGNRFFYVNPLAADGSKAINQGATRRAPWFHTACCPTNLARLIQQVPGLAYAVDANDLYVAFYMGNKTQVEVAGGKVGVEQKTKYPFAGRVELEITPETAREFALRLRIPTWTGTRFMPGGLYPFTGNAPEQTFTLQVNGQTIQPEFEKGLAVIRRTWSPGDRVQLDLSLPVRFANCDPRVKENVGRIAVTRGPLVYCGENVDNEVDVLNYFAPQLPEQESIKVNSKSIAAGHLVEEVQFTAARKTGENQQAEALLTLVPYYAWSNRGVGSMQIWFPRSITGVKYQRGKGETSFKSVSASFTAQGDSIEAIGDGADAKGSNDRQIPRWTSWNKMGQSQWVAAELKKPAPLRSVGVYWFDDGHGVKSPKDWTLETRQNGQWKPLELYTTDAYQLTKDQFNIVHPASPIVIDAVRVQMTPQPDASVGILELDVQTE